MSVDLDPEKLIKNIKRQSLRLKRSIGQSNNVARFLLGSIIYREKNLEEVQRKAINLDMSGYLYLSALAPDAPDYIIERYRQDKNDILSNIKSSEIAKNYNADLGVLLDSIFDITTDSSD